MFKKKQQNEEKTRFYEIVKYCNLKNKITKKKIK